jgi:hypothetical protein
MEFRSPGETVRPGSNSSFPQIPHILLLPDALDPGQTPELLATEVRNGQWIVNLRDTAPIPADESIEETGSANQIWSLEEAAGAFP